MLKTEMDESRNYILVARKEYTTLLVYNIYPQIYQGLKSIWEESKRAARPREVFEEFQTRLKRVGKWNQDVVEKEFHRIVEKTKCDWLEELIKRIFVINTQILAAASHPDPNRKIKVKVPKGDKFIHACYQECAKAFYENALLMEDRSGSISRVEQSKNLQRSNKLIMSCIETTIRNMLPIESLLKDDMEDFEGEDATPTFNMFSQFVPVHKPQPAKVSNFPSLTSLLEPTKPEETFKQENNSSAFDPESLFEPIVDKGEEHRDANNEKYEVSEKVNVFDNHTKPNVERPGSPDQDSERNVDDVKAIFVGKSSNKTRTQRSGLLEKNDDKDQDSDDSSGGVAGHSARIKNDVGGDDFFERIADIPVVSKKRPTEKIDLDVFSTVNELPMSTKFNEHKSVVEHGSDNKRSVPPLDNFRDSAKFFSDAED